MDPDEKEEYLGESKMPMLNGFEIIVKNGFQFQHTVEPRYLELG